MIGVLKKVTSISVHIGGLPDVLPLSLTMMFDVWMMSGKRRSCF